MTIIFCIALLVGDGYQIEATYPMSSMEECEYVRKHVAIRESYPGRVFYCIEKQ